MREIKFRAWDGNEMFQNVGVYVKDGKQKLVILEYDFEDDIPTHWFNSFLGDIEGFGGTMDIMQYTGLKDRKGKEIYEGDILKNESGRNVEVYYFTSSAHCGFDLKALNSEGKVHHYNAWRDWEVIGNIYENPELLPQAIEATE